MERKLTGRDLIFNGDGLVYPSQVFERPADVVNDPDRSLNKKRAILASWASDACAIEAAPALRQFGRLTSKLKCRPLVRARLGAI